MAVTGAFSSNHKNVSGYIYKQGDYNGIAVRLSGSINNDEMLQIRASKSPGSALPLVINVVLHRSTSSDAVFFEDGRIVYTGKVTDTSGTMQGNIPYEWSLTPCE